MEDDADIYEGIRAQFPLSFGKQTKSQTSLEAVHNATRRSTTTAAASNNNDNKKTNEDLPSISSSSKAWLDSLRNSKPSNPNPNDSVIGPPRPPPGSIPDEDEDDDDAMVGPPRPPPTSGGDDDNDAMVGPPRPPPASVDDEDDDAMIGPPRPAVEPTSDSDEDSEEENRYRIPVSNEIVLKGHTKVINSYFRK